MDLQEIHVLRDTREQERGTRWNFPNMTETKLEIGDYAVSGLQDIFTIERKGTIAEFATNIHEKRFDRELDRLDDMKYAFIIFEFEFSDLILFPQTSNIPRYIWPKLKVNAGQLLKKVAEYQTRHRVQLCFAGRFGKMWAESIFKRVIELEG